MNLLNTIHGSNFESILPKGWDMQKFFNCANNPPESVFDRQPFWNAMFMPISCDNLEEFGVLMGHEIALQIKQARDAKHDLILILPVGPMGMYKWAVYFLRRWGVECKHVHGFNMDEWADKDGNTLPADDPAAFQNAMLEAFYGPLGELTVPITQRHFATKDALPHYAEQIAALKAKGAKQVLVYGIGRMCHVAFWEPHFAEDYATNEEWLCATHRIGANLHPLTIEQNAITSFRSNYTLISCFANTIGPGIIFQSDYAIGGLDGVMNRGMQWQGLSFWVTLRHGPCKAITSTFIPTLPGRMFFMKELAGPLVSDTN